ncbi:MAG: ABC transporter substrate-binding protein [Desulfatitalea sp. BRH_c12]|nr:MAG: ABC transporter substrate-binding protein [Desulfatitalea sp. BRH_c12]
MKVRKSFIPSMLILLSVSIFTGLGFASEASAAENKMHIRFSTWHVPNGADVQNLWTPMLEEMKTRSNGRITYSMFAGGALGTGPDHYDIVKNGLSDMGYATLSWTPGRFPLTDVLSSPITCPAKWKGVEIGMGMYEKGLSNEFKDVKVLHINNCVMAHLWTTKKVEKLEDLKGMKIRSPGGIQTLAVQSLGATPIFMPMGDVYLSMETGVLDGVVTCPALVKAFKIHEVADFGVPISFGCVSEGLFMNKKTWERTPEDLKVIIEEVALKAYKLHNMFDEQWYDQSMKAFGEKLQIVELKPEEKARWEKKFQEVMINWAADLEKKGLPAKKTLTDFRNVVSKQGVATEVLPSE